MEEVIPLSSSLLSPDPSIAELIARLEKQVVSSMDTVVERLQSLQRGGKLDKETLKGGIQQVLRITQASSLIHSLPSLLATPTIEGSLQTEGLFKKVHQVAESLKAICKDQMMQAIDSKAAKILEQIKAKEQQIREQIAKKQQQVAQLVNSTMKGHQRPG